MKIKPIVILTEDSCYKHTTSSEMPLDLKEKTSLLGSVKLKRSVDIMGPNNKFLHLKKGTKSYEYKSCNFYFKTKDGKDVSINCLPVVDNPDYFECFYIAKTRISEFKGSKPYWYIATSVMCIPSKEIEGVPRFIAKGIVQDKKTLVNGEILVMVDHGNHYEGFYLESEMFLIEDNLKTDSQEW